jgi:BirA family biotin operon repressor/biotin-[acetyl-CoA-carboxylase] ligase
MHEIHFDCIDSTSNYAKKAHDSFPKGQITCIIADEQTEGRGRYQRKWLSPPGVNIYASLYFQLPLNTLHLVSLAQLMTLSLAAVLLAEGLDPKIKWPNDIQLNGKKLSGVLCETLFQKDAVDIILGIGINVNLERKDLKNIDQPATSLMIETGRRWDRFDLLKKLQVQFEKDLEIFKKKGFTPFHKQFEKMLALKGEQIRCFDGKKTWVGTCHCITEEGQLILQLGDGTFHTIISGDIICRS